VSKQPEKHGVVPLLKCSAHKLQMKNKGNGGQMENFRYLQLLELFD
jgi:hypothetical protein